MNGTLFLDDLKSWMEIEGKLLDVRGLKAPTGLRGTLSCHFLSLLTSSGLDKIRSIVGPYRGLGW